MAEISQNKNTLFDYDVYVQGTYTGLFGKGIEYNSVLEMSYEAIADATSEPVEEGGFASFYKTFEPQKITLIFGFNTDDYIQNQALTVIHERMKRYDLITVSTPQKMYHDMTITSISYSRESGSGETMLTITVTQEKGIVYQPRNPSSSNKENTGRKNDIKKQVDAKVDKSLADKALNYGYRVP